MAGEWLLVTQFITAAAMFALAGWLLWLKFSSPVNRSFALFLVVRGMISLINALGRVVDDHSLQDTLLNVREYYFLAIPPILAYFLLVYIRGRRFDLWRFGVILAAMVIIVAYMVDHCLSLCSREGGALHLGPLSLLSFGAPLAYGLVATILAWRANHERGRTLSGEWVIAVAFMLLAALESAIVLGRFTRIGFEVSIQGYEQGVWVLPANMVLASGVLATIVALPLLLRAPSPTPSQKAFIAVLTGASLVIGILIGTLPDLGQDSPLSVFIVAVWRLVLPFLVAYGLVRHRIFDAHVRVRGVARRGTLIAFFASAYFVFSEGAAEFFSDRTASPYIGIAAAALLLFALAPMQRVADHIVAAAMPDRRGMAKLPERDRLDLYRDQLRLVWRDGTMGPKERLLLDQLRHRLGLSSEMVSTLENRAAVESARRHAKSLNTAGP